MRVVVVGMNPGNRNAIPGKSLFHRRIGDWLNAAGIPVHSFVNLQTDRGEFDPTSEDIDFALTCMDEYDRVVSLGSRVHSILEKNGVISFQMPHPSGLNRQMNDARFVAERVDALARFLGE